MLMTKRRLCFVSPLLIVWTLMNFYTQSRINESEDFHEPSPNTSDQLERSKRQGIEVATDSADDPEKFRRQRPGIELYLEGEKPEQFLLETKWSKNVTPENVHQEYPRPHMTRPRWKNLNGLWNCSIKSFGSEEGRPFVFEHEILVPFPIESYLSRVIRRVTAQKVIWYQRYFCIPDEWRKSKILLHFGAVDWETRVWLNGRYMGTHRGGYAPFTFDVTMALIDDSCKQDLLVSVWDPTDSYVQPLGKQSPYSRVIYYTSVSGIWQTVWLEPVPRAYISSLMITPDIDNRAVDIQVNIKGSGREDILLHIYNPEKPDLILTTKSGLSGRFISVVIDHPHLWSPSSPVLYPFTVQITSRKSRDTVKSYFGMRKVSLGKDASGIVRILLNNKFLYQYGVLDQGYWPSGLYTPPSDDAMKNDIEVAKRFGFNMIRKHAKVESARWYYWCDKLGMLVWQDMPSGDDSLFRNPVNYSPLGFTRSSESERIYFKEWREIIETLRFHPSIIIWVPFNEFWGEFKTAEVTEFTKMLDPSRLVDSSSNWSDTAIGDILDIHSYVGPEPINNEILNYRGTRAVVLGEFGGLGLPVKDHIFRTHKLFEYKYIANEKELLKSYVKLLEKLKVLKDAPTGYSASVYTQLTDVEQEINGLLTYDREVMKILPEVAADAFHRIFDSLN